MLKTKTSLRVRYSETDKMGVVYHANYAQYFEVARTEMFREIGLAYSDMEANGIMLPLVDLYCRYHKPAYYDDNLTIEVTVEEMPSVKIKFNYKIYNEKGDLLTDGYTTLVFIDMKTNRPTRMPEYIKQVVEKYF
ncbi:MAG: acyl-CoA thioesterase [Bacteroidales bacterium]|nr:acyl-CoA thioesterase [Bacteroidales bacterium]